MDTYLFYKKYMKDLRGDQTMYYNGEIPFYSPSLKFQVNPAGAFGKILQQFFFGFII